MVSRSPAVPSSASRAVRRPRVAFVVSGFEVGGAELQLLSYLRLAPDDFDLTVIAIGENASDHRLAGEFKRLPVECYSMPRRGRSTRQFLTQLTGALRRMRPDIVHSFQDGSPGTWGRMAARLARVPCIVHSDRCPNPSLTPLQKLARPWLDRATTRFFSNAEYTARWVAAKPGVDPRQVWVIPNGVDLARFDPVRTRSARPSWAIPQGAVVAGFLGKLRMQEKRLDVLFEALVQMPPEARPDYLVVGGDGPDAGLVRTILRGSSWLEEHTLLLGLVSDSPAFLAGIDYLVLSSDFEGMPNVVLEAMAMSKPVVSTAVSDVPELIDGAGFLADPGDPASLGRALARMQSISPRERLELGRAGRTRVELRYDLHRIAGRFWEAHRELCAPGVTLSRRNYRHESPISDPV